MSHLLAQELEIRGALILSVNALLLITFLLGIPVCLILTPLLVLVLVGISAAVELEIILERLLAVYCC